MRMVLIAVGTRMPAWVEDGYAEYARRMPSECRLELCEIPAVVRGKSVDPRRAVRQEGERMLKAVPRGSLVVALDVQGQMHSTASLASVLQEQMGSGRDLALLVGGADGLAPECLQRAEQKWSLSRLTFPHPLVRVILAEQLYRAYSYSRNHPYHRA
jgi:23S rRNA (pseudouridine1915-N3)-methyltransferase